MPNRAATRTELVTAFRFQAEACRALGSTYTAAVLAALTADLEAEGATWRLLSEWRSAPVASAVALRLAGALNARCLEGAAPALQPYHPTGGGRAPDDAFAAAVRQTLADAEAFVRTFITRAVQTNEVQRSAVLAAGFCEIARHTPLPLDLFELGASGGLNLLWDRFAYRCGDADLGDPGATIELRPRWRGPPLPAAALPAVRQRRGVDTHPLDFRSPDTVRRGLAYLWPDQPERVARFEAAVTLLRASDAVHVETGSAPDWLPEALEAAPAGCCRVVYHSVMWQYMARADRGRTEAALRAAGARADRDRPLAWLRYEPVPNAALCELTLELWGVPAVAPGRVRLAWCHPHGASIDWLGAELRTAAP